MSEEWGNIFESEYEFLEVMDKYDQMIQQCAKGDIVFKDFLEKYNDFYAYYALDGHESDEQELALFEKYGWRIKPHEELAQEILSYLCNDDDALKDSYINAGRFGSNEALRRLKALSEKYFNSDNLLPKG